MTLLGAGEGFELFASRRGMLSYKRVLVMVLDKEALGADGRYLDGLRFLRDFEAGVAAFERVDYGLKIPFGAFQPGHRGGATCRRIVLCHRKTLTSPRKLNKTALQTGGERKRADEQDR